MIAHDHHELTLLHVHGYNSGHYSRDPNKTFLLEGSSYFVFSLPN